MLCNREGVDCGRGLAVHGNSLGGLLSTLSPQYAPVTALLVYAAGTYIPGADSCCGMHNSSCCADNPWAQLRGIIGGRALTCQTDEAQLPHLPRSRRRVVIGQNDLYYSISVGEGPRGARAQAGLRSGIRLGEECSRSTNKMDCLHRGGDEAGLNGWGYYIPSNEEVGQSEELDDHAMRAHSHAFWSDPNIPEVPGTLDEATRERYERSPEMVPLNPRWVDTDAPWGASASCDWLAETARRHRSSSSKKLVGAATLAASATPTSSATARRGFGST